MKKSYLIILTLSLVSAITQAQSTSIPTLFSSQFIQANNLTGTGFRAVYANALGVLTTNYTPPGSPTTTSIDTSYYSVPAAEFRRSLGGNIIFSNGEVSGDLGTHDTLIAPVNLPHKAVITKFTFCYKDNTGNTGMRAQLMNTIVNAPNRSVFINTAVTSATVANGSNYGCVNAPNIAIPTVGNDTNSYWIRVFPKSEQGNDFDAWVAGGGLRIVHFLIEYKLTN